MGANEYLISPVIRQKMFQLPRLDALKRVLEQIFLFPLVLLLLLPLLTVRVERRELGMWNVKRPVVNCTIKTPMSLGKLSEHHT